MKILIVTTRLPFPPYKGDKLRIFNLAKYLAKRNQVKIVSIIKSKKEARYVDELSKYKIEVVPVYLPLWKRLFNIILGVFRREPLQVLWFYSKKMKIVIKKLINDSKPDVVFYCLIRGAQYFDENFSKGILNVLDLIDAISLYLYRFYNVEKKPIKRFLIFREFKRVLSYEKIAEKFDVSFLCSSFDMEYLKSNGINANFKVIYNGINESFFEIKGDVIYDPKRIAFIGNLSYFPNLDAIYFFVREILPYILEKEPNAKFYIVGKNPPLRIRMMASKNIIVTGFVEDIKYEYLKSALIVAPIRFGAGMQNKIIEAIALGVPVVTTTLSLNGLPPELKEFVFVADQPEEFATRVIEILNNPKIRFHLHEVKNVVKKVLSLDIIGQELENYLANMLRNKTKEI
ncbi:Glycosyltransferase involved in cell wall bisynthesis [Candidatus Kryptobacter tengchongensis]|nr:Glycosyltransferase involved in cell wall bisynthesis [Candidatus Kryptobacter tengchongensis]